MGVPAGRQLDGAAGREAGTDERVKSGLTTFLTETKKGGAVMERCYETRTNGYDTMCHDDEYAISNRVLGELAKRGGAEART
jgi:hypothetical protein